MGNNNGTHERKPVIRTFPDVLSNYLEAGTLPPLDNAELLIRHEQRDDIAVAKAALTQLFNFIEKNQRPPTPEESQTGAIVWPELPDAKAKINRHPFTALQAYDKFDQGWSMEEIVAVVVKDPVAAYWLSQRETNAPLDELQAAANLDPMTAYFFGKNNPNANTGAAIEATKPNPYFHIAALKDILGEPKEAMEYLLKLAPYDPEAACTWFRIPGNAREDCSLAIKRRLLSSAKWSYLAAAHKTIPRSDDTFGLWNSAREAALRDPQWAYHWLAYIEPDRAEALVETVAVHPGWLAQLLSELPESTHEQRQSKSVFIYKATKACSEILSAITPGFNPTRDPYYHALTVWASEKVDEIQQQA